MRWDVPICGCRRRRTDGYFIGCSLLPGVLSRRLGTRAVRRIFALGILVGMPKTHLITSLIMVFPLFNCIYLYRICISST
jgi:hypothetical protein